MVIRILLIASLPFFAVANDSCQPTKEYAELRSEIYTLVNKPYNECKKSTKSSKHWRAVASCIADAQGTNAFDCGTLVENNEYPIEHTEISHCELLKPSLELFKQTLLEISEAKEIVKCKT
ncbi:hypothetical protein CXF85_07725 [Colwellia sp. 75C3]|uniref:hypothetical protein n=1 Tax=Colwellia sp. 75C3 TaxID=888425 RepID=UPI000C346A37|nr:hypothetical protein [Colwellia sp. 75C3]PKG84647.1 hypothetical protein CXF85_07725 [Colwellia sp. 75C3]